MSEDKPVIACFFTTFPKDTETFLQREVIALRTHGAVLRLYSFWGGARTFRGMAVERFNPWRLLALSWLIPFEARRRPDVLRQLLHGLFTRRAPSWLNFWENMLGAGVACVYLREFRRHPPALIHAAWGGAPATAAWLMWRVDGHRFSAAAHAYDLFEHGGDWWLKEKLEHAAFVHTSTEMGRRVLIERGLDPRRVVCIRRGLERIWSLKPLRASRTPLRIISVARLVEKKGLDHQLRIYSAAISAGVPFEARIVGEGPLRKELEGLAASLGVAAHVSFTGLLAQHEVWDQLGWADLLIHTGVVAASGDRDGLPNVIPEAMSVGAVVLTSPAAATTEAVTHGVSGVVLPVDHPGEWVAALKRASHDDAWLEHLRLAAHRWVEENFDAARNSGRLLGRFREVIGTARAVSAGHASTPAA